MIPLNSTTITITRVVYNQDEDGYDPNPAAPVTVVSGVRAVIGTPSASVALAGGERSIYTAELRCDPCDLQQADTVTDDGDGTAWTVLWARAQDAFGLDFMMAQLRLVTGST